MKLKRKKKYTMLFFEQETKCVQSVSLGKPVGKAFPHIGENIGVEIPDGYTSY